MYFLTKQETKQFLLQDRDGYVKNMTPLDLRARACASHEVYLAHIATHVADFTPQEIESIRAACHACDPFIQRLRGAVDGSKAVEIPWTFAKTTGRAYEDGLPHTRENIIFLDDHTLQDRIHLPKTLVHEKVHVYQRMYQDRVIEWLTSHHYKREGMRSADPRCRANPDTDPWIYRHPDGDLMLIRYATDSPKRLQDVEVPGQPVTREHPWEEIAYMIADGYS